MWRLLARTATRAVRVNGAAAPTARVEWARWAHGHSGSGGRRRRPEVWRVKELVQRGELRRAEELVLGKCLHEPAAWRAVLGAYGAEGDHTALERMMKGGRGGEAAGSTAIQALLKHKHPAAAFQLAIESAASGVPVGAIGFSMVAKAMADLGTPEGAQLTLELLSTMDQSGVRPVGHVVTSVVRALAETGRVEDAEAVMREAPARYGYEPTAHPHGPLLRAYGKAGNVAKVREIWEDANVLGADTFVMSAMVGALVDCGAVEEAVAMLMKAEQERSRLLGSGRVHGTLSRVLAEKGMLDEAFLVMVRAKRVLPGRSKYRTEQLQRMSSVHVHLCAAHGDLMAASRGFQWILDAELPLTERVCTSLMRAYANESELQGAELLLTNMHEHLGVGATAPTYTEFTRCCLAAGEHRRVLTAYNDMVGAGIKVDGGVLENVVKALCELGQWEHAARVTEWAPLSACTLPVTFALIRGGVDAGVLDMAQHTYIGEMHTSDRVFVYNFHRALVEKGRWDEAEKVFSEHVSRKCTPRFHHRAVQRQVEAMCEAGEADRARVWLRSLPEATPYTPTIINYTPVITVHGEHAAEVWDEVLKTGLFVDNVAHNAMLRALADSGVPASTILERVVHKNVYNLAVDGKTMGAVAAVWARDDERDAEGATALWDALIDAGAQPNNTVLNKLVEGGHWERTHAILDDLQRRGQAVVNSYNIVLKGARDRGDMDGLWALVDHLRASNIAPSDVTFHTILDACARKGDTSGVARCLEWMASIDVPMTAHVYSLTLKAMGAAGRVQGVHAVLSDMRIKGVPADSWVVSAAMSALLDNDAPADAVRVFEDLHPFFGAEHPTCQHLLERARSEAAQASEAPTTDATE